MVGMKQLPIGEHLPFPNNRLPVLIFPQVFDPDSQSVNFRQLFAGNGWQGLWVNGVYDFHHFHADAHEALGCTRGWVQVRLGGPSGQDVTLRAGDAVILPAGVGHQRLDHSADYQIVGAYPPGQSPDLQRGDPDAFEQMKTRVAAVPLPAKCPVTGDPLPWSP